MLQNPVIYYVMTAFVCLLIGLAKGGLGGLVGTLATPLMALVMPADQVIGLVLPMLIFADVFAVAAYWRRWKTRLALLLVPGGVAGVLIATIYIVNAPEAALRKALAVIVLIFTVYKLFEPVIFRRLTYQGQDWHGWVAGTTAGFTSALAHAGGPPVTIYLLLQKVSPIEFNATSVLFFAILNWVKVPFYWVASRFDFVRLGHVAFLLPLIPAGVWVGRRFASKINRVWFERVITAALLVSGIMLLF
jgi:uncharacterized membrane protein YfcA